MLAQRSIAELIDELADRRSDQPLVSLYLKASPQPDRLEENAIRLKNRLKQAATKLAELGVTSAAIGNLRRQVLEAASAWEDGSGLDRGLGIFVDGNDLWTIALPYEVEGAVEAGERFYLKPLFPALEYLQDFWLLALSQNRVSLYRGDGFGLREVETGEDVPGSLREVAGYEPAGRALHFHAVERGGGEAKWHGRGAGKDDTDTEIRQFLRAVDEGLRDLWLGNSAPVVLAGVGDLLASYRELSGCTELLDEEVQGNVEHLSEEELHRRAWPLVASTGEHRRREMLERLAHNDPGEPVARKLPDVLRAAWDGRVDTAFLAEDVSCRGRFDADSREVSLDADGADDCVDLIDRAAAETRRRGGHVHFVPRDRLPGKSLALARLRY